MLFWREFNKKSSNYLLKKLIYNKYKTINFIEDSFYNHVRDMFALVLTLTQSNKKILKVLDMVYDLAETARQFGISNFLAERIDAHQKHNWMLRATLS